MFPHRSRAGWVSVYALIVELFALVIGLVSDKFGRRRVLLIGAGLMTGAAMVLTMALLVWRFISETVNSQSKSEPHTSPEKSIYTSVSNIRH